MSVSRMGSSLTGFGLNALDVRQFFCLLATKKPIAIAMGLLMEFL